MHQITGEKMATGPSVSLLLSKSRSGAELGFSRMCHRGGKDMGTKVAFREGPQARVEENNFKRRKKNTLGIFLPLMVLDHSLSCDTWMPKIVLIPEQQRLPRLLEGNEAPDAERRHNYVPSESSSSASPGLDQTSANWKRKNNIAETGLIPLFLPGQRGLFGEYINKSFPWCQQLPLETSLLKG